MKKLFDNFDKCLTPNMKYYKYIFFTLMWFYAIFSFSANSAKAGNCYEDPVFEYTGSGKVKSAVFLRDQACMTDSIVLMTLSAGMIVDVVGYTDGWYRVAVNGALGWVGEQFIDNVNTQNVKTWNSYQEYMQKYSSKGPTITNSAIHTKMSDPNLISRVKGYILLQVQEHGEAWYVDPVTQKRLYMKNGSVAYELMRSFGLGVTDDNLNKISKVASVEEIKNASSVCNLNSLANRLKGRILLQVQQKGEAWYVYPKNCRMIYMKDGSEAYNIMRYLGLGITNEDLNKIPFQQNVE